MELVGEIAGFVELSDQDQNSYFSYFGRHVTTLPASVLLSDCQLQRPLSNNAVEGDANGLLRLHPTCNIREFTCVLC